MVEVERSKSPSLADLLKFRDEPSPAFSPVRDSQRSRLVEEEMLSVIIVLSGKSRIPPEIPCVDLSESHRARFVRKYEIIH